MSEPSQSALELQLVVSTHEYPELGQPEVTGAIVPYQIAKFAYGKPAGRFSSRLRIALFDRRSSMQFPPRGPALQAGGSWQFPLPHTIGTAWSGEHAGQLSRSLVRLYLVSIVPQKPAVGSLAGAGAALHPLLS